MGICDPKTMKAAREIEQAVKRGRAAAFAEIVSDLDARIAILNESIASGVHKREHVTCLQVGLRMLEVARERYASL